MSETDDTDWTKAFREGVGKRHEMMKQLGLSNDDVMPHPHDVTDFEEWRAKHASADDPDMTDATYVFCSPDKNPASLALSGDGRFDPELAKKYSRALMGDSPDMRLYIVRCVAIESTDE